MRERIVEELSNRRGRSLMESETLALIIVGLSVVLVAGLANVPQEVFAGNLGSAGPQAGIHFMSGGYQGNWGNVTPSSSPYGAYRAQMAVGGTASGGTKDFLFGGINDSGQTMNAGWSWYQGKWSNMCNHCPIPGIVVSTMPASAGGAMAEVTGPGITTHRGVWDVLFVGYGAYSGDPIHCGGSTEGCTYVWTGYNFINLTANITCRPSSCPTAREGAAMVDIPSSYDLMYGGWTGPQTYPGDSWKFVYYSSNNSWAWEEQFGAGGPSTSVAWAVSAYDDADSEAVLYGGENCASGCTDYAETCTYTATAGAWSCSNLAGPRADEPSWQMSEDTNTNGTSGVLMFGGADKNWDAFHTTWWFKTGTWTNESSASRNPGGRSWGCMAWDDSASPGQVMLFGGYNISGSHALSNTWHWVL